MPQAQNIKSFHAFVSRGDKKGVLLYPHRHEDGMFIVSPTRFEKDYIRVADEDDLESFMLNGLGLRMSNLAEGIKAPSLIGPKSVYRRVLR